ncbi:MAG: ABC transporter permease [Treponema sp.]|nr:ABC transporter permease [Treponema sp.]
MAFLLALRGIYKNKKNSAIIVLLIAVICFIFFIGNVIIEKSNISLYQSFNESLTGDVVIQKKGDVTMNLFGANTPVIDDFFEIPVLQSFDAIMDIVSAEKGVVNITTQVSGKTYLDIFNIRQPALLCGADADTYFPMFSGIFLEEGSFLRGGEYGAMITSDRAQRIKDESGMYPQIGDSLLFTSGGALGFKIRAVPIVGIFSYKNPGLFMNEIIITDPQTVRVLNSIQSASSSDVELSDDAVYMLGANIDDIFNIDAPETSSSAQEGFSAEFLQTWLSQSKPREEADVSEGGWNFIIINLENNVNTGAFINSLNKKLEPYGALAVDWRSSAGTSTILLLLIQVLFNAGMFLVCVAGVITVINIILISVFRRTREIGTLRAIGASDSYIKSLVFCENIFLSAIAGAAGILAGAVFISWVNTIGFVIPNDLISSLLGGNVLNLVFIPKIAFLSFVLSVILGVIMSIYPVQVTLKIEPIEAVRHG